MSVFTAKVLQIVSLIPKGKVASYGQVALYAGFPRGARQVGWILHSTESATGSDFPWWRVVNNSGRITIKGSRFHTPCTQADLLIQEGIAVTSDFRLDITRFRWQPDANVLSSLALSPDYILSLIAKYRI